MARLHRIALVFACMIAASPPPVGAEESAAARHQRTCMDALPMDANPATIRIACDIPQPYQAEVGAAEIFGTLIHRHDLAAWKTTDELRARGAFDEPMKDGRGWLTLDTDNGIEVRYFAGSERTPRVVASGVLHFHPFEVVDAQKLDPPQPMSPLEERLMRAKSLALASKALFLCSSGVNTVAIAIDSDGKQEIRVFVMSPWTNEAPPLGGYHMFRITEDGSRILEHYSQTQGCPSSAPSSSQDEALAVTHTTSATPTMFHVFLSLQYRKPIYVTTTSNGLLWRVNRGSISVARDDPATQAAREWAANDLDEKK